MSNLLSITAGWSTTNQQILSRYSQYMWQEILYHYDIQILEELSKKQFWAFITETLRFGPLLLAELDKFDTFLF